MQSLELEKEPYECEVKSELRKREEEKKVAAKNQRKGTDQVDSGFMEQLANLESRMQDGEAQLQCIKEEVRMM